MPNTPQILGQARPTNTAKVSLYSPEMGEEVIGFLFISNSSGAEAKARAYLDNDGTTYDEDTQILWDYKVRPENPPLRVGPICMNNANGNLAIRTNAGSALTFTFIGIIKT